MVTDLLLNAAFAIVGGAWALVPDWTIEIPAMQPFVSHLSLWNGFAPFTEVFQMAAVLLTLFSASIGFKLIIKVVDWIMDIIP